MGMNAEELLPRVLAMLAEVLTEGKPLHAKVEHGGMVAEVHVRPAGEPVVIDEVPAAIHAELTETPIQEAIVKVLRETEKPLKIISIASRAKYLHNSYFRKAVRTLVRKGIVRLVDDCYYEMASGAGLSDPNHKGG